MTFHEFSNVFLKLEEFSTVFCKFQEFSTVFLKFSSFQMHEHVCLKFWSVFYNMFSRSQLQLLVGKSPRLSKAIQSLEYLNK